MKDYFIFWLSGGFEGMRQRELTGITAEEQITQFIIGITIIVVVCTVGMVVDYIKSRRIKKKDAY